MSKTLDVLLVVLMLGAAAWTFGQKYQAEAVEHQISLLDRKIALEKETIQLLDADWSLLNQPNRLEQLAKAFQDTLKLDPTDPEQIVEPNQLPSPPVPVVLPDEHKPHDRFAAVDRSKSR